MIAKCIKKIVKNSKKRKAAEKKRQRRKKFIKNLGTLAFLGAAAAAAYLILKKSDCDTCADSEDSDEE